MNEVYENITRTKNRNWHWLEFVMACVAYVAANIVDYIFTIYGMMNSRMSEANPIAQSYMQILGVEKGLFLFKILMVGVIILGVFVIDLVVKERKIKIRSEYILYVGAVVTILGSSMWLANS